ncbi:hypothetical protein DUHN55_11620 [Helicobacter pylori]
MGLLRRSTSDGVREAKGDLVLESVTKTFGDFTAVDDLDLHVPRGSFFALLGPSGCGKTTTLRMVAGLEQPSAGRVLIGETDLTGSRPYERPVNTVFQSYALFPHLSIRDNVAFGPKRRGESDAARLAEEALELVQMGHLAERRPAQLSGGQQQRVALARAIVNRPEVLLLDEPLGALDLKLRRQMQVELKRIQTEVGLTFIHVTHDQEEAMTMADTVAVMNSGRIEQMGAPEELYDLPGTAFVAGFVGQSNLVSATVTGTDGDHLVADAAGTTVRVPRSRAAVTEGRVLFGVRPEKVRLAALPSPAVRRQRRARDGRRRLLHRGRDAVPRHGALGRAVVGLRAEPRRRAAVHPARRRGVAVVGPRACLRRRRRRPAGGDGGPGLRRHGGDVVTTATASGPPSPATDPDVVEDRRSRRIAYLLLLPGVLWLVVFFVVPVVQLFTVSLQSDYPGVPGYYYRDVNFGNYVDALVEFWPHMLRSLLFGALATFFAFVLAYPLAYAMAFKAGRWRPVMLICVIAPFFTSFILRTIAWRQILADDGIVVSVLTTLLMLPGGRITETWVAVVAGLTYNFLPFMVLPIYASLERADPRVIEAGGDLYANGMTTFARVTLPMSMPGVLAGTLLTFIPASGDYVNAELLGSDRSTKMVGNVIESQFFKVPGGYDTAAELSFTLMAMILVLVFFYVRRFGTEELV